MSSPVDSIQTATAGVLSQELRGSTPRPDLLRRATTLTTTGIRSTRPVLKDHDRGLDAVRNASVNESAASIKEGNALIVDEVLDAIYPPNEEIQVKSNDLEYDSLKKYSQAHYFEKALVVREVERLAKIVNNPDTALAMDGCQRLGRANKNGYTALAFLAKLLIKAKLICVADNDGISLVHAPLGQTREGYQHLIHRLRPTCEHEEPRPEATESVWQTAQELQSDAAALMDFVSACLARYASQVATGRGWRNEQIGALAKFTAKVKFLLGDMTRHAGVALRDAENALAAVEKTHGNTPRQRDTEEQDRIAALRRFAGTLNADPTQADYLKRGIGHCVNQQRARIGLMAILDCVLISLLPGRRSQNLEVTEYEVCAVIMVTGLQDLQTLLFQDRDFEYTGTSDANHLRFAHPAYQMLSASISHLARTRTPPQTMKASSEGTETILEWMYTDTGAAPEPKAKPTLANPSQGQAQTHVLQSMREVITAMALLALATPAVSQRYKAFFDMWYLTNNLDEPVQAFPARPFHAFARLHTGSRRPRLPDDDVLPLAEAVRAGLFSRTSLLGAGGRPNAAESGSRRVDEVFMVMDSWVYTEDAVIVRCGWYVWLVMLGAGLLVGGGLAIGLAVQDRLKGVDPFNITVYAWALAAPMVLVCKGALVRDWPWGDFLHRQVRCRSVTELAGVTGVNEQLIIAKLLHDEPHSALMVRGPYNVVFRRKSTEGVGGFAIDVPVQNKTLLLSGLFMIKVDIPLDYALVCLDVRKGTELGVVEHRAVGKNPERLMSQNIGKPRNRKGMGATRLRLDSGKLEWRKVEGVYNVLDATFV